MLKEVSPVYANINSVSVSGTITVIGSTSDIRYRDSVAVGIVWSGNMQGTVTVDGSMNYSAGLPQSGAPANSGDWASVQFSAGVTTVNVGSATLFPVLINLNQLSWPYLRVTYTNSTGSGLLTAYTSSKSLG